MARCRGINTYGRIGNLTSKTGIGGYDCSDNITSRNVDSGNYTLAYHAENNLANAIVDSETMTYTYIGDGTLVKKVDGSQTSVFVGRQQLVLPPRGPRLPQTGACSASLSTNASGTRTGEMRTCRRRRALSMWGDAQWLDADGPALHGAKGGVRAGVV